MAGIGKLRDLDITKDELNQIGEALKQKEFRQLLVDYVEEINDPENKKKFQEEVTQLEKERGFDVTFVNPEPGYVIKTSVDGKTKAFINICKSDKLQTPASVKVMKDGTFGQNWSLPYSQAPPREDMDKAGNMCTVYDVVFHPDTLNLAEDNSQFKTMVNNTALEAVEKNFNVKLDRKNIKFPKLKYKGGSFPTIIRKKSASPPPKTDSDDDDEILTKLRYPYQEPPDYEQYANRKKERKSNSTEVPDETPYTTPNYSIKHRNAVDMQEYTNDKNAKLNVTLPKEIIVEIELPLLSSTSEALLDVTEKSLSLVSEKPAKYKLNITLPYTVDEDAGNAKFDKTKRKLSVTLPLKYRREPRFADFGREDSGVESDIGQRSPESSGDDDSIISESLKSPACAEVEKCAPMSEEMKAEFKEETKTEPLETNEGTDRDSNLSIEVTKLSEDETVIEVTPVGFLCSGSGRQEPKAVEKSSVSSEDSALHEDYKRSKHPMLEKCRTLSESSGDELSFSPTRKGILKQRVSRSLSESSADDYSWPSPVNTIAPFGSDSCIPEEEGKGGKKTVRFNEIVHQKTFRTNSSILGQRKKNQRKMRNKKRAQERRASESENSEGESEKQKGRDNKTENNEDEDEEEEDVNEDESASNEIGEEVFETETKLQDEKVSKSSKSNGPSQSQVKGKKKGHKSTEASKEQVSPSKVDLKNDLIFDLDM